MDMFACLRRGRRLIRCALCVLVLCNPVLAWAAPVDVGFDQALQAAVAQSPGLVARRLQVTASTEQAARAAALPDPRLIVGLANWPVDGPEAFSLRADEMTTQQIGLMQEFPARAKRRAQQGLADAAVMQARSLSLAEQRLVVQAAAQAWIDLWTAQQAVQALQALREPARTAERAARARLAGGAVKAGDVLAAQAAALALENRIEVAKAESVAAQAGLARWLGTDDASSLTAQGQAPDFAQLPVSEARLLAEVDRQGPMLGWEPREAAAQAELAAAIADTRPDWSLEVLYGRRERAPDGMPRSDMLMIEVGVGLPLFRKNRQARGIAARRAELDMTLAERDEARRVQVESVRRALASWHGLRRRIDRQTAQELPLARDRARTTLAAYGAVADLQPWLDARRDEIELNLEHARLLGELGRAWAALAYLLPQQENTP